MISFSDMDSITEGKNTGNPAEEFMQSFNYEAGQKKTDVSLLAEVFSFFFMHTLS